MRDVPHIQEARQELRAILGSGLLAPSSRQARLLEYLMQKLCEGKADDLKEYTIAVELFQKHEDFDQQTDAIVRVEAHRLRKKLEKYYDTVGRDSKWRIKLPSGHYCLQIQPADLQETKTGRRLFPRLVGSRQLVLFGILTAAVAVILTLAFYPRTADSSATLSPAPKKPETGPIADPEPDAVRILAGLSSGSYADISGRVWNKDRFFEGGTIRAVNIERIARTGRPELFRRVREGRFGYRIPLKPGRYELRLYFVDPDGPAVVRHPERRFRILFVTANGRELGTWNLVAESGDNADIRAFKDVTPDKDGFLNLRFENTARSPAVVSAIEILPMRNGKARPIRIVAQAQPYWDSRGVFWSPDDYYSGGSLGGHSAMITGGADPGILSNERYGDFEYFIPVPEDEYRLNLYFGESWFGPGQYGGGSVGSRVFDVRLNHELALPHFDLLRESPPLRLIVRSLQHVVPDRTGKIRLTFTSQVNHATVRAIEVLPEE